MRVAVHAAGWASLGLSCGWSGGKKPGEGSEMKAELAGDEGFGRTRGLRGQPGLLGASLDGTCEDGHFLRSEPRSRLPRAVGREAYLEP